MKQKTHRIFNLLPGFVCFDIRNHTGSNSTPIRTEARRKHITFLNGIREGDTSFGPCENDTCNESYCFNRRTRISVDFNRGEAPTRNIGHTHHVHSVHRGYYTSTTAGIHFSVNQHTSLRHETHRPQIGCKYRRPQRAYMAR